MVNCLYEHQVMKQLTLKIHLLFLVVGSLKYIKLVKDEFFCLDDEITAAMMIFGFSGCQFSL